MSTPWKVLIFALGLLAGALCVQTLNGQEMCKLATVEWQDAVIRVKTQGHKIPDAELLIPVISIGCIRETETSVIIIHSFTDGKVDDYLTVPKAWTTKITKMVAKEEDAPKSEANPQKGNPGKTPPVARQTQGQPAAKVR